MHSPTHRSFLWDTLIRSGRFFYLLWGGMLLTTLALYNRLRLPSFVWELPGLARWLTGPWGRGFALGLGLAMALAALVEVWELVDRLLVHVMRDEER